MSLKRFHLSGYFDRNFGDDMIMKLIVNSLPDVTFYIDSSFDTPLFAERNVVRAERMECEALPKVIVTGSGFMINTKDAFVTELKWFLRGRHPGDYCLGCNIEPLDGLAKRFLIQKKLNKFKLITCRDSASFLWLTKFVKKPKIEQAPDILFSLPDALIPRSAAQDYLGIAIMHRKGDEEDCPYYQAMAAAADFWVEKTGKGVLLMAFDSGKEDDIFGCNAVKKKMRFADKAEIVVHTDGSEILEAYSKCERIVGARFHSMVLALRMGIPFYPVFYRKKMINLISDLSYPTCGCSIDSINPETINKFLVENPPNFTLKKNVLLLAQEHSKVFREMI